MARGAAKASPRSRKCRVRMLCSDTTCDNLRAAIAGFRTRPKIFPTVAGFYRKVVDRFLVLHGWGWSPLCRLDGSIFHGCLFVSSEEIPGAEQRVGSRARHSLSQ